MTGKKLHIFDTFLVSKCKKTMCVSAASLTFKLSTFCVLANTRKSFK